MTDKEIIKALECIQPRILTEKERVALDKALDLITRQQAERDKMLEDLQFGTNQVIEQQVEIDRLRVRLRKERHQFEDLGKMYSEIRTEATKEFAERLKEDLSIWNFDFTYYADRAEARGYIDNLVKEMVGE